MNIALMASLGSLIFVVGSAIMALAFRAIIKVTKMEDKISSLVENKEDTHERLFKLIEANVIQLREDRKATTETLHIHDERLWELHDAIRDSQRRR